MKIGCDLKVCNVSMNYGRKNALSDVSFSAHDGTITGVIGANGCGKTTLLKMIAGLIQDYRGKILVCNCSDTWKTKQAVCYHPTLPFYQSRMTIGSAIRQQALLYRNFREETANELFQRFEINLSEQLGELSRGTLALALLILSLSIDTRIYLLDEPFSGIDIKSRSRMKEVLLSVAAQGKTMLIATHELSDLEELFDFVLFMKDGKVVIHCPADELRESFGNSIAEAAKELI